MRMLDNKEESSFPKLLGLLFGFYFSCVAKESKANRTMRVQSGPVIPEQPILSHTTFLREIQMLGGRPKCNY